MSRFQLTGHDRYRVRKAREALTAAEGVNLLDETAMARMIGLLEVNLQQLVEMVDQAQRDEAEPAVLPGFGPTAVQNVNDDTGPAVVVVRVDFQMSREELVTALSYGYADTNVERPVEGMSVEEVRADVEGYLAATGYLQFSQHVEDMRAATPASPAVQAAFEAAIDRAYPTAPVPEPRRQSPRYPDGAVVLDTLDCGEIVTAEPAWCTGHDNEPVVHLADITHNGRHITAAAETEHGTVDILDAHLSHAPYAQRQPEPHPVISVTVDVEGAFTAEGTRQVAHGLHVAGLRLARLVADAARLQRGDQ